jgi:Fur family ferric uptake transcriptional regulator
MNQPHASLDASEILAQHGLRVTDQRRIVLEAMLGERNDATAQGLHERLRPAAPRLGLATVYRTLNALADAGVLDRLHHDATGTCFRYCGPGHHHHLTCRICHKVVELRDCDLADWATTLGRAHGFADINHSLELDGVCDQCTADSSSAR